MSEAPAKQPRRHEDRFGIRLLQAIDVCYARIYHQVIVRAPHCLPHRGAAILVCNHTSHIDPLMIQSVCPRLITWMMTREFYDLKYLTWLFRSIGAIRVERSGRDMAALRAAIRSLEEGRVLGIFPEGKIESTPDLLPFQTGVALIAIKTGVPIYPAYLDGTQRKKELMASLLHPQRATLTFGPAVEFDRSSTSREVLDVATEQIKQAVANLKSLSERRAAISAAL